MPDLYAAIPPLEFLRMVLPDAMAAASHSRPNNFMVCDVSRAYFCACSIGQVYVKIADEE